MKWSNSISHNNWRWRLRNSMSQPWIEVPSWPRLLPRPPRFSFPSDASFGWEKMPRMCSLFLRLTETLSRQVEFRLPHISCKKLARGVFGARYGHNLKHNSNFNQQSDLKNFSWSVSRKEVRKYSATGTSRQNSEITSDVRSIGTMYDFRHPSKCAEILFFALVKT